MLLPRDFELPPHLQDGPLHLRKSLSNLRKSIQSLLGSKQDLTFRWAESVRFIIEDISAVCELPFSPSNSGPLEPIQEQSRQNIEEDLIKLEGELAKLRDLLKEQDSLRSRLHNQYLDLKGNVRVFCRVKPILSSNAQHLAAPVVTLAPNQLLVTASGKKKAFQLDKIFVPMSSQDDVFAEVGPLVRSALDGYNVCVFAYGQTGAGKTFTMEGTRDSPGIVPRTLQLLFHLASLDSSKRIDFTFSMLELYMGSLRDLLVPGPRCTSDSSPKCLTIQMDTKGGVEVENLTEYIIKDVHQASQLYLMGSRGRSTARTNSNEVSSRSHCLIRITTASYEQSCDHPVLSKLWLIDLGGSERLLKTNAKGHILEEGKAINLSLSALGDVINALKKRDSHIPYRNSKLTQILRDSLGDDAKTVILVHVSPREEDVPETICTLSFATRARGIHLGKELSQREKEDRTRAMEELKKQLEECENNCQYLQGNIQELEFLCRKKREMLGNIEEQTMDECRPLPALAKSGKDRDKRDLKTAGTPVSRPRFMTATASSRLKGRPEIFTHHAGDGGKVAKAQRRSWVGYVNRKTAKVSPVDHLNGDSERLNPDQTLTSNMTLHRGTQTKLRHQLAGLSICPTTSKMPNNVDDLGKNLGTPLSRNQERQAQCRSSHHVQEHAKQTIRPSTIFRKRLMLECTGEITVY